MSKLAYWDRFSCGLSAAAEAPSPRIFSNPAELHKSVGEVLGPTHWIELSQERINLFAEATQDFQVQLVA